MASCSFTSSLTALSLAFALTGNILQSTPLPVLDISFSQVLCKYKGFQAPSGSSYSSNRNTHASGICRRRLTALLPYKILYKVHHALLPPYIPVVCKTISPETSLSYRNK